ncbi:MAG: Peptidyl-prolyl cis-trans isomerase [Myxococcaceae bacterium]|nr:Peptidyl-prolyl cis-trans isomerase [Myxococcaceae bacterium]
MPRPRAHLGLVVVALAPALLVAASGLDLQGAFVAASDEAGTDGGDVDGAPLADGDVQDTSSNDGDPPQNESGADTRIDAPADGGPDVVAPPGPFVWAHSSTDLYKIDVGMNAFTTVPFQGCGVIQDLGVSPAGLVDAISTTALYRVGPTGVCTKLFDKPFPFTLSYAAAATVQPLPVLVAFEARDYVRFDSTGTKVVVKNNALANGFSPSGDVACAGSSCYVSVVSATCADCLQELDATTGNFIKDWGPIGYAKVFGLACAAGKVYGFTDGGNVLQMTLLASGLVVSPVTGLPAVPFIGAGSLP